jgi:uncharacterized MAPEG superfamily protein
MMHSSNLCFSL